MHAIELAELTSLFAGLSSEMLLLRCAPGRRAQQDYWLEARFRHDFWCSQLASHRQNLANSSAAARMQSWSRVFPVLEEILLSEPLARCVAYHARLLAERGIESDLAAVAQSVLSSHVEARHRCLHLIVFGESLDSAHSSRLNQLRRGIETYTDTVLSFMGLLSGEDQFSFDPIRVRAAQRSRSRDGHETHSKQFILSFISRMMRIAAEACMPDKGYRHPANERLHTAVIGFLPASLFDYFGLPISTAAAGFRREPIDCCLSKESLTAIPGLSNSLSPSPSRLRQKLPDAENPRW
jgi:hypothetical protein